MYAWLELSMRSRNLFESLEYRAHKLRYSSASMLGSVQCEVRTCFAFQHFHHLRVNLKLVIVIFSSVLEFKFPYKMHANPVVAEIKFMLCIVCF